MQHNTTSTIAVALSGGADSLYTLISLKESGIPVIGIHGKFIPDDVVTMFNPKGLEASEQLTESIAKACKTLDVPFHCVKLQDTFLDRVIRPFVQAYAQGETPNPCALCNTSIKFGLLLNSALKLGAEHLATGHYARLEQVKKEGSSETLPQLLQGKDPFKDQSYFLGLVPKEQLRHAIFPLGEEKKSVVLSRLAKRGIVPPAPIESQEVCFIPSDTYRNFLPHMAEKLGIELPGAGPMLLDGKPISTHKGLWQYTEGQRKGLGVAWKEPLHVIIKDKEKNALILGAKQEAIATGIICGGINILLDPEEWPDVVYVKARYREQARQAHIRFIQKNPEKNWWGFEANDSCIDVDFLSTETSIAQGQLASIYIPVPNSFEEDGRPVLRLVAGGLITEVKRPS